MARLVFFLMIAVLPVFSQTGYVKDWLILGTFPNPDGISRLSREYIGEESTLSPRGGDTVDAHQWILYHSTRDFVDFLWGDLEFDVRERCVVYAAFFVHSPSPQSVRLLVGSDDAIAVWSNGKRIHFAEVVRGLVADNDTVAVELLAGWNTLVLKIANNEGGYGASARFADGDGLVLSAQNPFPPRHALTPPLLVTKPGALSFRFQLTDQNGMVVLVELPIRNTGSAEARNVQLEYTSSGKAFSSSSLPSLAGGEFGRVLTAFTFAKAAEIAQSGTPLSLRVKYEGHDTAFSFSFSEDLMRRFFEPWQLEGWAVRQLDEKSEKLSRVVVVPEDLTGLSLQFAVDIGDLWGSIAVNGNPVLARFSGDSGELELTAKARAGEKFEIEVTVKTEKATGLKALLSSTFRPRHDRIEQYFLDARFAKAIYRVDAPDQAATASRILGLLRSRDYQSLDKILEPFNQQMAPYAAKAKQLTLHMIGNAHIDMAWLWRYPETIEVTRATFQSALDNLRRYPDFHFSHGQAHSYYWIEQQYPEMLKEIQKYVKEGRWEIVGGTWIESDGNMPSGESFARQYLYGKRYFKSRFGVDVKHGYHPDTFGHAATLPQILSRSGIETYTFFRPGDDERIFWWETPDGSRVLAHHPLNWYGTWSGIPDTLWTSAMKSQNKFAVTDVVQFFGVGDHGGGPTRRQIEQIEQLSEVHLYPKTQMSTFGDFYQNLIPQKKDAPVQRGELNPVFEGCYTSQATIKRGNRRAEAILPTAELFSAIAMQFGYEYPAREFEEAWHNVLFNQFHDILCGSGIHDVYTDADQFYEKAFEKANGALQGALKVLTNNISTLGRVKRAPALVLFNPLSWNRKEPIEVMLKSEAGKEPRVIDEQGREIVSQVVSRGTDSLQLVFLGEGIPSLGYRTYWIDSRRQTVSKQHNNLALENRFFKVEIDSKSGCVSRIYDKLNRRDVLKAGMLGNEMQIQEDDAPMSAWVIGLRGQAHPINVPSSVRVIEAGLVRTIVRSEYAHEKSSFTQDVVLYAALPRIDFRFAADWRHRKRMLKIVFPLNITSGKATFEIPYGAIERTSDGHETVAQKWVDISTAEYGVSLLNDSKYGFDVKDDILRMTALRSSTDPDPNADEGLHEFRYALYPHSGGWKSAQTVLRAYRFNTPVISVPVEQHRGRFTPTFSFITFSNPNVVLTSAKKCEDDGSLILRCYEPLGKSQQTTVQLWQPITGVQETDLTEWNARSVPAGKAGGSSFDLSLKPTEIKTLKLTLGKE